MTRAIAWLDFYVIPLLVRGSKNQCPLRFQTLTSCWQAMHSAIVVSLVAMHGSILEETMHGTKSMSTFQCAALHLHTVSSEGLGVGCARSDRESLYDGRSGHIGGGFPSVEPNRVDLGVESVSVGEQSASQEKYNDMFRDAKRRKAEQVILGDRARSNH